MTIENINTLDVDVVASNRGADSGSKCSKSGDFRSNKWITTIPLDAQAINEQWQQWRSEQCWKLR